MLTEHEHSTHGVMGTEYNIDPTHKKKQSSTELQWD
jgi:hypothetical protein